MKLIAIRSREIYDSTKRAGIQNVTENYCAVFETSQSPKRPPFIDLDHTIKIWSMQQWSDEEVSGIRVTGKDFVRDGIPIFAVVTSKQHRTNRADLFIYPNLMSMSVYSTPVWGCDELSCHFMTGLWQIRIWANYWEDMVANIDIGRFQRCHNKHSAWSHLHQRHTWN